MRSREGFGQRYASLIALVALGAIASGCRTIDGGPDRLYTIDDEVLSAKAIVQSLTEKYYGFEPEDRAALAPRTKPSTESQLRFYRNEIIARRMYIIDVEYSDYEAALTSERQKFGFLTSTVGSGLSAAAALTTPVRSAQILSGTAAAVGATRGFYDSEIVIAKTIQIAQAQMRTLRDQKATWILGRTTLSIDQYPLSQAMHDLEDYYRAGTLTAGLIKALGDAGTSAQEAAADKETVVTYGSNASTKSLRECLNRPGVSADDLVKLLTPPSHAALGVLLSDVTSAGESRRNALLKKAKAAGVCP